MKTTTPSFLVICFCLLVTCPCQGQSAASQHSFPAIGMTDQRQVDVAWNRFYDCQGFETILKQLNQAFPELTRLVSIGQSVGGRQRHRGWVAASQSLLNCGPESGFPLSVGDPETISTRVIAPRGEEPRGGGSA